MYYQKSDALIKKDFRFSLLFNACIELLGGATVFSTLEANSERWSNEIKHLIAIRMQAHQVTDSVDLKECLLNHIYHLFHFKKWEL